MAKRKYKRLHYEDRQTIEAMSKQGNSVMRALALVGRVTLCRRRAKAQPDKRG